MDVVVPHFKVPFSLGPTGAAVVEQDSIEDVEQCVEAICRTPLGSRLENPDFGMPDLLFKEGGPDIAQIERVITNWEPRSNDIIDFSDSGRIEELVYFISVGLGGV